MRSVMNYKSIGSEIVLQGSPLWVISGHLRRFYPVRVPGSSPCSIFTKKLQTRWKPVILVRSSPSAELSPADEEWLKKLPDKKKALYSHSLPSIEAWLKSLGFYQSRDDRALWFVEKPDWHAQLSLDITDLFIRYLKTGPGNLDKDVERRFSYALSREDIENAILGGP
ncbi:tRNA dimethylallyltransferase [Wolffia australiana]